MSTIKDLIGAEVLLGEGRVSTDSFCGEGKIIGLYFSAHWCPPCRMFTPQLAEFYKKFKETDKGKDLEIVFVSSDRDEEGFKEYYAEMPWHGLPFELRDLKTKLSKQFKISGIPSLIFVDGANGKLINAEGRNGVMEDPEGKDFPWRPVPLSDILTGEALKGSEKVDLKSALEGKIRGFYFSAHWCPPCRSFTPVLCETYKKITAAGKKFELVFVSSDRDEKNFNDYFAEMPFMAIPFSDQKKRNQLSRHFEVQGIPSLVILDENNEVITSNARPAVTKDKNGENFPWYPKPLDMLTEESISIVNDQACLMYLSGDGSTEGEARAKELLTDLATSYAAEQKESRKGANPLPELAVLYEGPESDDLPDSVRSFASLPDNNPLVVLLDIPDQKKYILPEGDVTKSKITQIFQDFKTGKLNMEAIQDA